MSMPLASLSLQERLTTSKILTGNGPNHLPNSAKECVRGQTHARACSYSLHRKPRSSSWNHPQTLLNLIMQISISCHTAVMFAHKLPFGASTLALLRLYTRVSSLKSVGFCVLHCGCKPDPRCPWGPSVVLCGPQTQNEQMSREKKRESFEAPDAPIDFLIYSCGKLYFQSNFTLSVLLCLLLLLCHSQAKQNKFSENAF